MKTFFKILLRLIFAVIIIAIIAVTGFYYKVFYFNDFVKAQVNEGTTLFYRDKDVKLGDEYSFCIESEEYNDAVFYKNVKVEPNTGYRVTCKIKTEGVQARALEKELENSEAEKLGIGACISVVDTAEQSKAILGEKDWQEVELIFNSKNRENVNICFRLGGCRGEAKGKTWFTDIKLEKMTKELDNNWNVVCFNINNIDANLNGKKYRVSMTAEDKLIIRENLERFAITMEDFSCGKMDIETRCIEINEPLTTLSYNDENAYYIEPKDVYDLIDEYVQDGEYDHIFIATRMGDITTGVEIPVNEWIGLGGMRYEDIGFSNIRLPNDMKRTTMYKYDLTSDTFPEEVFVHEFLHTLERNLGEYETDFPKLHDNKLYGYKEDNTDGLKEWYKDYLTGTVRDGSNYVGLSDIVYSTMPLHTSDFKDAKEIEFNNEPSGVLEGFTRIIKSVFNKQIEIPSLGTIDETNVDVSE